MSLFLVHFQFLIQRDELAQTDDPTVLFMFFILFNSDYICGTFSLFNFGFAHLCYLFWGEDDEAFAPQVVEVYKLPSTKTLKTKGL